LLTRRPLFVSMNRHYSLLLPRQGRSALTKRRPVVGIIGNSALIGGEYPAHAGGTMNSAAVAEVAGALPILIPADPHLVSVAELLEVCDGFLLTGGRPNVHPEEYGEPPTEAHGDFDRRQHRLLYRVIVEGDRPA